MEPALKTKRYVLKPRPFTASRSSRNKTLSETTNKGKKTIRIQLAIPANLNNVEEKPNNECVKVVQTQQTDKPLPRWKSQRLLLCPQNPPQRKYLARVTIDSPTYNIKRRNIVRFTAPLTFRSPENVVQNRPLLTSRSAKPGRRLLLSTEKNFAIPQNNAKRTKNPRIEDMLRSNACEKGYDVEHKMKTISTVSRLLQTGDLVRMKVHTGPAIANSTIEDVQSFLESILLKPNQA